jgi:maleylacetoacetate isomerase
MATTPSEIILYTYFRSSCSARVRIALDLKNITYQSIPVNLLKDEQSAPAYCAINSSGLVPSLEIRGANIGIFTLTQSVAILEYLEEAYQDRMPLLPPMSDPTGRAHVRTLVNIIACDIQPVTNLRILGKVDAFGASRKLWARELISDGLKAYEALIGHGNSRFSVGDDVTLADVCLIPAVWGAIRFEVDLAAYPRIKSVYDEFSKDPAVKRAHWNCQPDTPSELRELIN